MAKGHSGNAFATDFTSMFNGISSKPAEEPKAVKEEPKPAKAPATAKKAEPKAEKEEKKPVKIETAKKTAEVKPAPKKETKVAAKKEETKVIPKNPKSIVAAQNGEVYITISLLSAEDRDYLKFRSKELGLTTSEFFWSIVEDDVKAIEKKKIDPADEKHREVKAAAIAYTTSVKLKNEQKELLTGYSVRHRLSVKKYCAYVVNKARLADVDWF